MGGLNKLLKEFFISKQFIEAVNSSGARSLSFTRLGDPLVGEPDALIVEKGVVIGVELTDLLEVPDSQTGERRAAESRFTKELDKLFNGWSGFVFVHGPSPTEMKGVQGAVRTIGTEIATKLPLNSSFEVLAGKYRVVARYVSELSGKSSVCAIDNSLIGGQLEYEAAIDAALLRKYGKRYSTAETWLVLLDRTDAGLFWDEMNSAKLSGLVALKLGPAFSECHLLRTTQPTPTVYRLK